MLAVLHALHRCYDRDRAPYLSEMFGCLDHTDSTVRAAAHEAIRGNKRRLVRAMPWEWNFDGEPDGSHQPSTPITIEVVNAFDTYNHRGCKCLRHL